MKERNEIVEESPMKWLEESGKSMSGDAPLGQGHNSVGRLIALKLAAN
jgi:hypothetical protein